MKTNNHIFRVVITLAVLFAFFSWSVFVTGGSLAETTESIHYVKPDAVDGTCADWENACGLQTALGQAEDGDEIWVAEGVHYPGSGSDPRTVTFQLESGVEIYGGFDGTETQRDERDWDAHLAILSGDIDRDDILDDGNAYHVVSVSSASVDETALLDGFIITAGNATGISDPDDAGGGMRIDYGSPTLRNIIFSDNSASVYGGGMVVAFSSPSLTNVVFINNTAANGGGIYNWISTPSLQNVIFIGNTALIGGGMDNRNGSDAILTNVVFNGNFAGVGGGMHNDTSSPTLTNAIVWGNTPDQIYNDSSTPSVTYSDIQGGYTGTGNINADPLFVDPDNGNMRLQRNSPAIDAGDNDAVPAEVITDLDGSPRRVDIDYVTDSGNGTSPIVDMGAYEVQAGAEIIYVDRDAPGPIHDGQSWESAFTGVQSGLAAAQAGNEIWVAEGTYYPGVIGNRNATFQLKSSAEIYGGFAGTEEERDERNWDTHPTILSGDIDRDGTLYGGNAYHVVTGSGVDGTAILDGFTITGGKADGIVYPHYYGGGMYNETGSPMLTNLTFSGNSAGSGGGMDNTYSNPTLTNVTFTGNSAGWDGGGMVNWVSSPTLTNVTFSGNSAGAGGGMFNGYSNPTLTNVTFSGNSADDYGGGMYNRDSSNPTLTNAIVWGNTPDQIYNDLESTADIYYSDIQGGFTGTGNIDDDPLLGALADNGGATLTHALPAGSPAIDAGDPENCPATDQRGMPRPTDGDMDGEAICDMGAVEYQPATTTMITGDAPDPSYPEEFFNVTFAVTAMDGNPTGDVTVTVGGETVSCSATLTNGEGNCQLALETPGSYTLTATYAGSAGFETSSDSETHTVIEDTEYPGLLYLPMVWK